jgi:hypothetical protein
VEVADGSLINMDGSGKLEQDNVDNAAGNVQHDRAGKAEQEDNDCKAIGICSLQAPCGRDKETAGGCAEIDKQCA